MAASENNGASGVPTPEKKVNDSVGVAMTVGGAMAVKVWPWQWWCGYGTGGVVMAVEVWPRQWVGLWQWRCGHGSEGSFHLPKTG